MSTDPDPDLDPDPDHNPNLTMHRFAGKLLGYMKGRAGDSQLVMKAHAGQDIAKGQADTQVR